MSTVNITSYTKPKTEGGSGGSVFKSTSIVQEEVEKLKHPRKIWGHVFDGTKDVEGDFSAKGNWVVTNPTDSSQLVTFKHSGVASGKARFIGRKTNFEVHDGSLSLSSSSSKDKLSISPDYVLAETDLTIEAKNDLTLKAKSMTQKYEEGHLDLGIKGDLKAGTLFTNNLYDYGGGQIYVGSPLLLDGGLDLNGDLTVKNLFSQNITNDQEIRTKDLTVTGNATFFDLVIAEVQAVGGQIILSAADFRIDAVEEGRSGVPNDHNFSVCGNGWIDGQYRTKYIYQIAEDRDGQKIDCKWKAYDQIISYTANVTDDSQLAARSWWTLVLNVETDINHLINGEIKPCHRLEIVEAITQPTYTTGGVVPTEQTWINPVWGPVNPMEGDNCALLGSNDPARQNAIILSAYNTFDLRLKAPCIAQYQGIVGYELPEPITYFARNGNKITGNLVSTSGKSVQDMIEAVVKGRQTYMHMAWADSEDGATNFTKTKDRDYAYEGLASTTQPSDEELTYTDYLWMPSGSRNKLLPTRERLYLSDDDNLYLDVEYLKTNWTEEYEISAEIVTYGGAITTRKITDTTNDGKRLRYAGLVQKGWSGIQSHAMQYCAATIYLKDSSGRVIDSRTIQLVFDAGAILSITDSIRARVGDAEGNIASVVMTSRQILTRITSLESSLQLALNDDSAELRIDDIEGRINDIKLDVNGLVARVEAGDDLYDDNWIRQRLAQYEITLDGFSSQLEATMQNAYDDTWVVTKFHNLDVSIDGLKETIRTVESQGYDDSSITERISTLSNTVDGLRATVQQITTVGDDQTLEESDFAILANRVYARVTNNMATAGIDITAGKIELDADNTDILGTLNIKDDNNSGIYVYDNNGTPVIQISPDDVGSFTDEAGNRGYFRGDATQHATNYGGIIEEKQIGYIEAGQLVEFSSWSCYCVATTSSSSSFSSQPVTITFQLKLGGSVMQTISLTISQQTVTHLYNSNQTYSYTTGTAGIYSAVMSIACSEALPSGTIGYTWGSVMYEYKGTSLTTLGKNGFVSKTGLNKMLISNNEGIIIRQNNNAWKFTESGLFRGLLSGTSTDDSLITTMKWIPAANYLPTFQPGRFEYTNISPINSYRWAYEINPATDIGDCLVLACALDTNHQQQETWILLPQPTFKQNGITHTLPVGYRVRIINGMIPGDNRSDLFVSTRYDSIGGYGKNVIYDGNSNWNSFSKLNSDLAQNQDTYLWTGTFWMEFHDPQ